MKSSPTKPDPKLSSDSSSLNDQNKDIDYVDVGLKLVEYVDTVTQK